MGRLPPFLRAEVGGGRVGIVHGDAWSLAGRGYSEEAMPAGLPAARAACYEAQLDLFASSLSCLPLLQTLGEGRWLTNDGAAGMRDLQGVLRGLFTRVATTAAAQALAQASLEGDGHAQAVHVALCPVARDDTAWRRLDAVWPPGSDAGRSHGRRMQEGPGYLPGQVQRA